ncbi:MAG: ral stress protein [Paenibacillus sp.]|jgi:gas vesicle protein|nr:ral stress protein [Paenibacillus sp.]
MATETKSGGFLLGVVIGGAVGAISSLLLAPKSGAKMREELSERYQPIKEKTQELASAARDKTKEVASSVTAQASELMDKAKEGKQQVSDMIQAVKDTMPERTEPN